MPVAVCKHSAVVRRAALTLVEILIALTMTLIVLGTMMTAFKYASEEMQNGRAMIELSNRTRTVEDYLRADLASITVEPRVHTGATEPNGYFEVIEGPARDFTPSNPDYSLGQPVLASPENSYLGDCDDIIAFTSRSSDGVLYRGRFKLITDNTQADVADMQLGATTIEESSLAEIVWFTTVNDNEIGSISPQLAVPKNANEQVDFDDSVRIHRRQLLIRPDLAGFDPISGAVLPTGQLANELSLTEVNNFIRNNDISVRVVQGDVQGANGRFDIFANDLQDLAVRGHRFAHDSDVIVAGRPVVRFPNNLTFGILRNRIASDDQSNVDYVDGAATQQWQPLPPLLTDVAGFDVRVYSPNAAVGVDSNVMIEPGDIGYAVFPAASLQPLGAYVDLGYAAGAPATRAGEWFIGNSAVKPQLGTAALGHGVYRGNVWDTWTPVYERDGVNQNIFGETMAGITPRRIDEGANGADNGGTSVIDDPEERETMPPYANPLRALKVNLRLVEKGTKRVHQISVVQSFVPE